MSRELKCCEPEVVQRPDGMPTADEEPVFLPRVDIVETHDAVVLTAEMPGVDEKNAEVSLDRNVLTIRGTVKPTAPEGYSLSYSEYDEGSFSREFTLSSEVDRTGLQATLKNGVLCVSLPKARQAVAQKVAITAG